MCKTVWKECSNVKECEYKGLKSVYKCFVSVYKCLVSDYSVYKYLESEKLFGKCVHMLRKSVQLFGK